ncbi:uncharacterized protein LOC121303109 [Polyodon spathula]|uniref:uncharacterized protein LOC121303109 n=1 Tax=Polyodon spathula TaxID=7913 RepID=UPI001B7EAD10|nr:uncharacterized protein LOC121303109 [Polyodon spathula]
MSNNKCLSSDLTKKIFSVFLDFEADCPLLDKRMQVERPLCDSGLQLRVSGYVRKVRQAVTLVLVVEKMKRPIGSLMKHVMEDQTVLEACLDSDSSRDWDSPWNLDIFWYSDGSRDWDSPWYLDILWYSGRSWFLDISWHPDSSQGSDSSWESARLSQEHVDEPHSISDIINNKWVLLFPPRLTAVMLVGIDLSQQGKGGGVTPDSEIEALHTQNHFPSRRYNNITFKTD